MRMTVKRVLEYLDEMEDRSQNAQTELDEFDTTYHEENAIQDAVSELRSFVTKGKK